MTAPTKSAAEKAAEAAAAAQASADTKAADEAAALKAAEDAAATKPNAKVATRAYNQFKDGFEPGKPAKETLYLVDGELVTRLQPGVSGTVIAQQGAPVSTGRAAYIAELAK